MRNLAKTVSTTKITPRPITFTKPEKGTDGILHSKVSLNQRKPIEIKSLLL